MIAGVQKRSSLTDEIQQWLSIQTETYGDIATYGVKKAYLQKGRGNDNRDMCLFLKMGQLLYPKL